MPRRKPFSAKQKKAQLQDKRAVKRGDLDSSDVRIVSHTHRAPRPGISSNRHPPSSQGLSSTRLTSRFIALSPAYLEQTRDEAYNLILPRPVPVENGVFPVEIMQRDARVVETASNHGNSSGAGAGAGVDPRAEARGIPKQRLTCPARPKFRYDMSKKEVEKNEEGYYVRWLSDTERIVRAWVEGGDVVPENGDEGKVDEEGNEDGDGEGGRSSFKVGGGLTRRSPTWFETNLEVWRQLWRVTESSQIILLLLDARCPPLHLPHSLRTYIQTLKPRKQVILVLTKSDLVDPIALQGWKVWVKEYWREGEAEVESAQRRKRDLGREKARVYGNEKGKRGDVRVGKEEEEEEQEGEKGDDVQVVAVRSYDTDLLYADKARHRPDLPVTALAELITALRTAHDRLKTPHSRITADKDRLAVWESPVRSEVDWDLMATGPAANDPPLSSAAKDVSKTATESRQHGVTSTDNETEEESDDDGSDNDAPAQTEHTGLGPDKDSDRPRHKKDVEAEPLTLGLIGQPNVGKSSLLNALMGETRVRASKTPGKTKHFQTLFWGWKRQVKIVDCPGLVCPSLVGMEIQALCGILPISQIPSLAACITTAAHLMPLEEIFRVPLPPQSPIDEHAHKKTYRDGMQRAVKETGPRWTAGAIMEARALDRGFITAKGGRPDTNRAANGMMRSLAEGKIRWCFYPPTPASGTPACASTSTSDAQDSAKSTQHDAATPSPESGSEHKASNYPQPENWNTGRGIWLGNFEHDDPDEILSTFSDDDDLGRDDDDTSGQRQGGKKGMVDLLHEQRFASSDEEDEDSEDDGEIEEAERKGREIDKGFFAALDLGAGQSDGEEDEEEEEA